ncbi:MAG: DUF1501 domain-containing protein [Pirellula sp.]
MKRRAFTLGAAAAATGIALDVAKPSGWMQSLAAELATQPGAAGLARPELPNKILVVLQLSGGNDGLNTVIPYRDDRYKAARPKLQFSASEVLAYKNDLGLNPGLKAMESLWEGDRFCVVQGVGYASPNRSHFESMDIWHTCHRKQERRESGWIGRFLSGLAASEQKDAPGVHVGAETLPLALVERGVQVPSLASIEQMRLKSKTKALEMEVATGERSPASASSQPDPDEGNELLGFVETSTSAALEASARLERALAAPDASGEFPATGLGEKLKVISRLILAGVGTQIYYVTLDGFDTHANQAPVHSALMKQWADAVSAFCNRMQQAGLQEHVLVMTFSEFGRRVAENASGGTDHGAAAPMFLSGPTLPHALVGEHPSLQDLDDGDLKFRIDFREVYASVIEHWLGASSIQSLDGDYRAAAERLRLFASS